MEKRRESCHSGELHRPPLQNAVAEGQRYPTNGIQRRPHVLCQLTPDTRHEKITESDVAKPLAGQGSGGQRLVVSG